MTAWAGQELGLDPDTIRRETEKFTDHFRAKGEAKLDWAAAWRNWMRRAAEGAYGPAAPPLPRRVARPDRDIGLSNDELDRMIAAGDLP
jgi:hypothetical protein